MSLLDDLMQNANDIIDIVDNFRKTIDPPNTDYTITIPNGTTQIAPFLYQRREHLVGVTIPDSVQIIGHEAFYYSGLTGVLTIGAKTIGGRSFNGCAGITRLICESGVESIDYGAFVLCSNLSKVVLPNTIKELIQCFGTTGITTINLPASLTRISGAFANCQNLEFVTIENGFNCNGLDLSSSTLYSADTIVSWLNALADRTGDTAYTLTIGTININKLTAEQIAIATNKNWNLA